MSAIDLHPENDTINNLVKRGDTMTEGGITKR